MIRAGALALALLIGGCDKAGTEAGPAQPGDAEARALDEARTMVATPLASSAPVPDISPAASPSG